MAKSADAADLKSAGPKGLWEFKSPSGHHRIRDIGTHPLVLYERGAFIAALIVSASSHYSCVPLSTHEFQDSKALRHMEGIAHGGLPGKELPRLPLTAKEVHAEPAADMG
jgi:hypothetical protein